MGKPRKKPVTPAPAAGKPPAQPKPVGRPSSFTPDLGLKICARLAHGESLRAICRDDDMPDAATVFRWLAGTDETHTQFREQYARAREAQADYLAEEILEISDDGTNDWMLRQAKDGEASGWTLNGEHVQRSKLRVDSRKWFAGKVAPKKYGDKQQVEHSGAVTLETLVNEAVKKREGA